MFLYVPIFSYIIYPSSLQMVHRVLPFAVSTRKTAEDREKDDGAEAEADDLKGKDQWLHMAANFTHGRQVLHGTSPTSNQKTVHLCLLIVESFLILLSAELNHVCLILPSPFSLVLSFPPGIVAIATGGMRPSCEPVPVCTKGSLEMNSGQ